MVVEYSSDFLKSLKKFGRAKAKEIILRLDKTLPSDGKFVALVKNIVIKEKKEDSFRFYFLQSSSKIEVLTEQELREQILKFVAISKKNNQQEVIDNLKKELRKSNFYL